MSDPMMVLAWALAALVAVAGVAWWLRARAPGAAAAANAESIDTLIGWQPEPTRVMTPSEHRAFNLLQQALPGHIILAQVSVARFVRVPTRNSYAEWLRRVGHLCGDLVVCDARSQVIAVVEIRSLRERSADRNLERADRRQQRFQRVLKAAGIPLHVWLENALPSADDARRQIVPEPVVAPFGVPQPVQLAVEATTVTASALSVNGVTPAAPAPAPEPALAATDDDLPPVDEVIEVREPPSSTWFDDFDSGHVPLSPQKRKPMPPSAPASRSRR